ncbi:hypothetical protein BC835DRAFT_1309611 [Cytidiella melzeri]|nr:hypothetical protein BC835DRAFT_1309611 [Cytidiella melzeri]
MAQRDTSFPYLMYSNHTAPNIVLDETELFIMAAVATPITVIWHNQRSLEKHENWPDDRKWSASSGKSVHGAYAAYVTHAEPIADIGRPGDLWIMPDEIHVKQARPRCSWERWHNQQAVFCPYDQRLQLIWSHHAHFKYMQHKSLKTETNRWNHGNVPERCIPMDRRSEDIKACLSKLYADLTEADILRVVNLRFEHLRQRFIDAHPYPVDNPPIVPIHIGETVSATPASVPTSAFEDEAALVPAPGPAPSPAPAREVGRSHSSEPVPSPASPYAPNAEAEFASAPASTPCSPFQPIAKLLGSSLPQDFEENSSFRENQDRSTSDHCMPSHQPTYDTFPKNKYRQPPATLKSSSHVECWNQMDMFLPATPNDSNDPEIAMLRWLAAGFDATAPPPDGGPPLVTVLQTPPAGSPMSVWEEHVESAREALARRRVVLVLGATESEPEYEWNEKCLCALASRSPDGSLIEWLAQNSTEDKRKKNTIRPVKGDIRSFLSAANDPQQRVNCLDIATPLEGSPPYIIRQLSTSARAMSGTCSIGFQPAAKRKPLAPTTFDSGDFEPEGHAQKKQNLNDLRKAIREGNNSFGPQSMDWDAVRQCSWALFGSTGVFTGLHHDAAGLATFAHIKKGTKLWSYLQSEFSSTEAVPAMLDHLKQNHSFLGRTPQPDSDTWNDLPPGILHQVYTLENAIVTGGHFLMMETMHLTEMTRVCAVLTNQRSTNATHPGTIRLLGRLVFYLAYEKPQVSWKLLISLARMIMWPERYVLGDTDPGKRKIKPTAEALGELSLAQNVIKLILVENTIDLRGIEPGDFDKGEWLASEEGVDWMEPGSDLVEYPEFEETRRYYVNILQHWQIILCAVPFTSTIPATHLWHLEFISEPWVLVVPS